MKVSFHFIYHFRASRYQNTLWENHRNQVTKFLNAWNPKEDSLLLFGPSGGYSLSKEFLSRFKTIIAIEPDLIARRQFEKRFGFKPQWIKKSIRFDREKDFEPFRDFKGAVLFCNLLGQIPMASPEPVKKVLNRFLAGRSFASYHDALSGQDIEFDTEDAPPLKASLRQMREWIYIKNEKSPTIQVNAHLAPDLFDAAPGLSFRYWFWKLSPKHSHLIEAVYKNA